MDCGDYYHEAQSGKSKRENRENNGHLVHKTFTPNKQKLKYNTNKKSKEKMVTVRYVMYSVCRLRRRCSKCSCQKQIWLNRQWPDHVNFGNIWAKFTKNLEKNSKKFSNF